MRITHQSLIASSISKRENTCAFSQVKAEDMLPDEDICDLSDFFKMFGDSSGLKCCGLCTGVSCVHLQAQPA